MNKHFIDRDKIMDRREFYKLPRVDQRALMSSWRLTRSTEEIKKEMNLSTTAFYALLKRLDLPTNLKAHRDAQPSLLNDNIEVTKIDSNTPTSPSKTFDVEVNVNGRVDANELSSIIKMVRELDLDITIKS